MRQRYLNKPGASAAEEARLLGCPERVSLKPALLRELFEHHRWLASEGQFGTQLALKQDSEAYRKDICNCDLDGVEFSRAAFAHVQFVLCSLKNARFKGAQLDHVVFLGCDLTGTDFGDAKIINICFEETNYKRAYFDRNTIWSRAVKCSLSMNTTVISCHTPHASPKI